MYLKDHSCKSSEGGAYVKPWNTSSGSSTLQQILELCDLPTDAREDKKELGDVISQGSK